MTTLAIEERMHITFLCHEYPPGYHGGVGSKLQVIGRALAARGHRVTVVGVYPVSDCRYENDRGVNVIRIPSGRVPKTRAVQNSRRLNRVLRQLSAANAIDVLEGTEQSLAFVPRDLPAVKAIRMSGGHHFFADALGKQPRWLSSWIEKRSFARATRLVGVSRYVAEQTRQLLKLGDREITVLPNPVDTEVFRPMPDIREEEGLMVFVGSLCEKKGLLQLVLAMSQIAKRVPHARLLVAGRDTLVPGKGSFRRLLVQCISPDVRQRIEFLGAVPHDELPQLLARAQVCVYPSFMEAMPNAWLEGMAMGKPVVVSAIGPAHEIIEPQTSGLLCNPYEPDDIARACLEALQDSRLRSALGRNARQRILDGFAAAKLVGENEKFYRESIEHARRRGK